MKEILRKVFAQCCLVFLLTISVSAKKVNQVQQDSTNFSATLFDDNQVPLNGIEIKVEKTSSVAFSSKDGIFSIPAKLNDVLLLSLNGHLFYRYKIDDIKKNTIIINSKNVVLKQERDTRLLFGVVTNPINTATSSDAVYTSDVTKLPVTSLNSALTGRLSGLYALQSSGQPGSDGSSLSLRGRNPLLIIDGIPRGLSIINLEEIESVTVLKDALSTAMLGVKGFNGALLITTKRGSKAKQMISFTAQTAFQSSLKQPMALNSYNYAMLYNEAAKNDGLIQPYTQADLTAYATGSDPIGHPDVDWRNQILKKNTRLDQYSLDISGGNDWGRYFVALEHINQSGFFKTSADNTYDTNNKFLSYVIRSNIDLQINSKLSAGVNLLGRILNGNGPGITLTNFGSSTQAILNSLLITPNNAYPVFNPNGSYGTSANFQTNIYGQVVNSGYTANYKRDVLADFFIKRTLNEITEGLWTRAAVSLYSTLSEDIVRSKTFAAFAFNPTTNIYTQYGNNGTQANGNQISSQARSNYMEYKIGYDHQFGENDVSAVVIANRDNLVTGSNLPYTIKGISGRAAYTYNNRYTFETAFAYNGSNYYPPEGDFKFGFFPAVGVSWNVAKENFLINQKWLNGLKLYASYGRNGNDNPGYFSYIQQYFDGAAAYFGSSPGSQTSIFEQPLANPNISFETAKKLNLGIQGSFFNSSLGIKAEYYNNKYADLLMQRGKNSAILGQTFPNENIGKYEYNGWDFNVNWQQQPSKDLGYFIAGNFSIQDSEVIAIDEVDQPFPWMRRTGSQVGQSFGYIADGLFQSQSEILESPKLEGYVAQPGDVRYKDLNGDGLINQFDQTAIGQTKPLLFFGLNLGFQYKSFDFSTLIQGAANRVVYLSGNSEWAFQNNGLGQAWEHNLDRWTPTNLTGTYPRVNVGTNINNYAFSTFWMHSGNYLRIKNIELGYTLPPVLVKRVGLQSTRIFFSGTNLLTLASFDRVDPEVYNGAYPIQRLLNFGINIKL
ncbi:SusC/RagA family TonB-linked outer membrane protein [Pedobacter sp. P26]|uniref:SusC/RagA family TonB-linked outer membrane protein n=1 Tax=Pedobacter sp. P26 TaxID=3423956 RepID=UPI003D679492